MSKTIAVVQSNYIPWRGYFDLINSVDEFILYDDVQHTIRDWRNRNIIKVLERHNVALPHSYWSRQRWLDAFAELNLKVDAWIDDLGLYPLPLDCFFGCSLHFITRLGPVDHRIAGLPHAT
jgi:hypothetical protein